MATQYWNGSAWVKPAMKVYDGTQWADVGGEPTLDEVKTLIDGNASWQNEITQYASGEWTITSSTYYSQVEIRGLSFTPDLAIVYGPLDYTRVSGKDAIEYGAGIKIPTSNQYSGRLGGNQQQHAVGGGYRYYNSNLYHYSSNNNLALEYSDGFTTDGMVFTMRPDTTQTFVYVAVKFS